MRHQTSKMDRRIHVIVAVLACVVTAASSVVLAPFPHGKTTVYEYRTIVTTTTSDEEILFSSQFVVQGILNVTHDNRDPELTNAYNVVLSNVTTDMHNGKNVDYDEKPILQPLDTAATAIEEPFLIIYNTNGTLKGVKIGANEAEWSKNMKMAMASTLQIDLPNINMANPTNEPRSFVSHEKTIHGDCAMTYNVHLEVRIDSNVPDRLIVNNTFTPMNCSGYYVHDFKNVDHARCEIRKEPRMFTDSSKKFEMEKQGDGYLIRKLVADGYINVLSANGASYPHFVITNTTLKLMGVEEKSTNRKALGNFEDSPTINDLTYREPRKSYVPASAVDVTQGRHVVELGGMTTRLEKLILEALSYIEENHLELDMMDWDRSRTINKIMDLMSYMDYETLKTTFGIFEDMVHPRAGPFRNIFLGIVSQVGTPAACNFTRNVIRRNKIPPATSIVMLSRFAFSVRVPTIELLAQMEDLAELTDPRTMEVRKAGILSFATLVYRTFKHLPRPEDSPILNRYLRHFFNRIQDEPTYEMKIVYLMAMRNIQIGRIHDFLEPIVNGSLVLSKDPNHIRLLAIWAIDKSLENDYKNAHRILWPVMVNASLPIKLRIAAYEILINRASDENSVIAIHDHVSNNANEHFYNYHYKTMDMIAGSLDPCKTDLRKFVRSVLKNIVWPPKSHENIHYPLSDVRSFVSTSQSFVHAEEFEVAMIVNELNGLPEVGRYKHVIVDDDGAVDEVEIQLHIEEYHGIWEVLQHPFGYSLSIDDVRALLDRAAKSLPATKKIHIDVVVMIRGRVVIANNYNPENIEDITDDAFLYYYYQMRNGYTFNHQIVNFDRLYEKQITSDIGIPIIVKTQNPILTSLKFDYKNPESRRVIVDIGIEFKKWQHSEKSMSIYNPIKNVWHAVRSATVNEMNVPFRTIFTVDHSKPLARLSFPKINDAKSAIGVLIHGGHMVTIDENDDEGALKQSCSTCLHRQIVHDSTLQDGDLEKYTTNSVDFEDVGLNFTASIYKNSYGHLSEAYYGYAVEWDNSYKSNVTNSWNDVFIRGMITVKLGLQEVQMDALLRSTGGVLKVEPSTENPISHVELKMNVTIDDFDKGERNYDFPHAERYRFNGSIDFVSDVSNATVRMWKFDGDVDMNREHLSNKVGVMITRKSPEEIDYNICINVTKNYPIPPEDDLMIGQTIEEFDGKLIISYGYTNEKKCSSNETTLTITTKAELSDEQKNRLKHDMENGACSKDKKNPMHANLNNLVPRTINCMNEAIRYTTLRRYNVDVTHKKLSFGVASELYRRFTEEMEPTEDGHFKVQADFTMEKNAIDFQWMDSSRNMTKQHVYANDLRRDGRGPSMKPLWDFPLVNTRFDLKYLYDYTRDNIRICTVYPRAVVTGDGDNVPFNIPSDQWILISGEHNLKRFAIFAKQSRPNYLSFVALIRNHGVRFYTRESDNALVAVTNEDNVPTDKGFRLPIDENFIWNVKVTKRNDHFVVRMRRVSLTLLVGHDYISIIHDSEAQGRVSGLCGHLNGTYVNGNSEIFTINEISKLS